MYVAGCASITSRRSWAGRAVGGSWGWQCRRNCGWSWRWGALCSFRPEWCPGLGHPASIGVDNDQLQEVCLTATLSSTSVVDLLSYLCMGFLCYLIVMLLTPVLAPLRLHWRPLKCIQVSGEASLLIRCGNCGEGGTNWQLKGTPSNCGEKVVTNLGDYLGTCSVIVCGWAAGSRAKASLRSPVPEVQIICES